jgi:hypothetical protein
MRAAAETASDARIPHTYPVAPPGQPLRALVGSVRSPCGALARHPVIMAGKEAQASVRDIDFGAF